MLIPIKQAFDLESTLYSGQSFRWRRDGDWSVGVVFDNIVKVRQVSEGIEYACGPDEETDVTPLLTEYLGLGSDLDHIYHSVAKDERIVRAIGKYWGMRILRQEPWECLISFIISSNSNILRISGHVEDLANTFGRPLRYGGHTRNTFPAPSVLRDVGERRLREMRLGFRAPYVDATAKIVADGEIDLFALREAAYDEALQTLTSLPGVGDKVANCVLLFSLDKLEAFPVDVWVRRALQEWYLDERKKKLSAEKMRLWAREYFGPYAGYANQYMFQDRRLQTK